MSGMEVNRVDVAQTQPLAAELNSEENSIKAEPIPMVEGYGSNPNTTPPTSVKFNYKNFPHSQRDVAARIVSDTVSDVDHAVRHQTGENRYVVDYDTFPNPADYKIDGMKKKEQFDVWKDDVTNWKNRQLDEIEKRNHATVDNLNRNVNQLRETVIQGFMQTYAQLGWTQQEMENLYQALNGNLDQMKAELQIQMQELRQGVDKATGAANYAARVAQREGEQTRDFVKRTTSDLHDHIEGSSRHTREIVRDEGQYTRSTVRADGNTTRAQLDDMQSQQEQIANLRKEINIAIYNNPSFSKAIIRTTLESNGYGMDFFGNNYQLSDIINNVTDLNILEKIRKNLKSVIDN